MTPFRALTDVSGTPMFAPLHCATLDGYGEAAFSAIAPAGSSGLDFTLIAYVQRTVGSHGIIDSSKETIAVR